MSNTKSIIATLSKSRHTAAVKLLTSVREFEEEKKGRYIAFVDGSTQSFDVSIEYDATGILKKVNCDCELTESYCVHVLACVMYYEKHVIKAAPISESKTAKKVTRKKKLSKHQALIQAVEPDKILEWLAEAMKEDKKLAMKFKADLIEKIKPITVELLDKQFAEILKVEKGRRRSITAKESQSILKVMQPYYYMLLDDQLIGKMHDPESKKKIECIYDQLGQISLYLAKASVKVSRFEETITAKYCNLIYSTKAAEVEEAFQLFGMYDADSHFPLVSFGSGLLFFDNIAQQKIDSQMNLLLKSFAKLDFTFAGNKIVPFFKMLEDKGKLKYYITHFPIIKYSNKYNLELLRILAMLEHDDLVKSHCEDIFSSYNDSHATPYFNIYMKVLKKLKLGSKYVDFASTVFFKKPTREMYSEIVNDMGDEQKVDFYTRLMYENQSFNGWDGLVDMRMDAYYFLGKEETMLNYIKKYRLYHFIEPYKSFLSEKSPYLFSKLLVDLEYNDPLAFENYQPIFESLIRTELEEDDMRKLLKMSLISMKIKKMVSNRLELLSK